MPFAGRRNQLVFTLLQSVHRAAVFANLRKGKHLQKRRRREMGGRQDLPWWVAEHCRQSKAGENPKSPEHPYRRDRLGVAAARTCAILGRNSVYRNRTRHLRRRNRRTHGFRCDNRKTLVELSNE